MHNILFTTDEKFAQHCGVCTVSLLKNNPRERFSIVVVGMGLSESSQKNLKACVNCFDNAVLEIVDFQKEKLIDFPQIGHYQKNIYLRLWVDEFFGDDVEKVLYLDVDTIVVDSISELFEIDLKDNVLASVNIPFATSHNRCHLPLEYEYFNSGVLIFNLKQWRLEDGRQKILDFLLKNSDIALNPDQDALNGVFYKKRLTLDYTYNAITPFFKKELFKKLGVRELSRIRENVKIVHFNGNARPWIYTCNHPYQRVYFKYLKYTPWSSYIPEDKSVFNYIKKQLRFMLGIESFVKLATVKGK
ncbi:glycosyltransferase family 8 protein [Vibrio ziniensis]|uniref:Glycosyltransferase family 8 protein n=1 Tax=Vibrio ziniensis TaxID=2711221 RepID=A0A6G7CMM4_9VIBR|nr:glycosyltransferase family 8 protein [Vibrio ziniensis]QIH43298.1 glycosyltransferase family 8 protein [Vibrio ziniensis]